MDTVQLNPTTTCWSICNDMLLELFGMGTVNMHLG